MKSAASSILTINGGSSSIKFAQFEAHGLLPRILKGSIDRIGSAATFAVESRDRSDSFSRSVTAPDHAAAVGILMEWVADGRDELAAVGHRVVQGGPNFSEPQPVTTGMIEELRRLSPFDPEHLPQEIQLVEAIGAKLPDLPQVLCFDTAFHRDMPRRATQLPIPRRYESLGIRRYGFHGLSYTYLMQELARLRDPHAAHGRVVLAHLGSGASLAAVRDGRCVDTTMGFTPTGGLMMGTRSGDLDPGVLIYLAESERMDAPEFRRMLNHESGLKGVSDTSADVRDLLKCMAEDARAAEAIGLFCYLAKKAIASFAGALGGVDTLVFAGGIGENSPEIRARICDGLGFLGIALCAGDNARNADVISAESTRAVTVRVIRTDEESVIAQLTTQVLDDRSAGGAT